MSENCNDILIFQIFGQFEAALKRIPEAQSVTLLFSLIVTFYLTRTENRTKNLSEALSKALSKALSEGYILIIKRCLF